MPSFTLYQLINPQDSHLHRRMYTQPTARSHTRTRTRARSQPTLPHNLEGDIRNKFDTSAYPRSALRTKRNLILDKPPDRISALAFCCGSQLSHQPLPPTPWPDSLASPSVAVVFSVHFHVLFSPSLPSSNCLATSFYSFLQFLPIAATVLVPPVVLVPHLMPQPTLSILPAGLYLSIYSPVQYIPYISTFLFFPIVAAL